MNKRVFGLFLAFAILLCMSSVIAASLQTTVIVHGPPFHNYVVRVLDPTSKAVITSVYPQAHYTGISNETFATDKGQVTFLVIDRYNGDTVAVKEDFPNYYTGKAIELWLEGAMAFNNTEDPVSATPPASTSANSSDETETETDSVTETTAEESPENETAIVTGLISSIKDKLEMKYLYYLLGVLGGVGVVVVLFVFGKKMFHRKAIENEPRTIESFEPKEEKISTVEKIADAEERLMMAKAEIDELKEKEIRKAERKLQILKRLDNVQQKIDNKGKRSEPKVQEEVKEEVNEVAEEKDSSDGFFR